MMTAQVDVLIATIGRKSLEQAILATLHQTYPHTRCVVVADGPCQYAYDLFAAIKDAKLGLGRDMIIRETPERFGHGNRVKEWWVNHAEASPFIRFLDDDDWIPPCSVAEMMRPMADPNVVLTICKTATLRMRNGRCFRYRLTPGIMKPNFIGCSFVLFRTSAARGVRFPDRPNSDYYWIAEVAKKGRFVHTGFPLYWYNAYRTNAER